MLRRLFVLGGISLSDRTIAVPFPAKKHSLVLEIVNKPKTNAIFTKIACRIGEVLYSNAMKNCDDESNCAQIKNADETFDKRRNCEFA